MKTKKLFIYKAIHSKYDNNIIPEISDYILSYVLRNPDKANLYLSDKITVDMLLDRINKLYESKAKIKLLDEIIKFIEVDLWKIT